MSRLPIQKQSRSHSRCHLPPFPDHLQLCVSNLQACLLCASACPLNHIVAAHSILFRIKCVCHLPRGRGCVRSETTIIFFPAALPFLGKDLTNSMCSITICRINQWLRFQSKTHRILPGNVEPSLVWLVAERSSSPHPSHQSPRSVTLMVPLPTSPSTSRQSFLRWQIVMGNLHNSPWAAETGKGTLLPALEPPDC